MYVEIGVEPFYGKKSIISLISGSYRDFLISTGNVGEIRSSI